MPTNSPSRRALSAQLIQIQSAIAGGGGNAPASTIPGVMGPLTNKQAEQIIKGKIVAKTAEATRATQIAQQVKDVTTQVTQPIRGMRSRSLDLLRSLPIPGSIALPLGILLLLTLVLLPVGGHTRLMWLWLAFTGNAVIGAPPQPSTVLNPIITTALSIFGTPPSTGLPPTPGTSTNTGANPSNPAGKHPASPTGPQHPPPVPLPPVVRPGHHPPQGGGGPPYDPTRSAPAMNPNQIQQRSYTHTMMDRTGYE